jgi:predicted enzyme related to lactoylglutathione lyase
MPRPVHFEISADDMERAKEFYEQVFGWRIEKWEGPIEYWNIMTGEESETGIDGGLMRREEQPPGTVNTIDVPNLDEYMAKAKDAGAEIVMDKMPVPGVGWMCYIKDTEDNVFGMMEMDESAK